MLKKGNDHFEVTKLEPKVNVCEKHYVFDAEGPNGRAVSFSPSGKCPAYQLDKTIADTVLDRRRQEQLKMAEYIAQGVATAPAHVGDGGMNPVFAEKLNPQPGYDSQGRLVEVATAPGALPRAGGIPATTVVLPQTQPETQVAAQPAVLTSVPVPSPAPQPKTGTATQQPTTIAGLIGNLFGGSQARADAAAGNSKAVALRGTNSEVAAKPKHRVPRRSAAEPAVHKPQATTAQPKAVAAAATATAQTSTPRPAASPAPAIRTAISAPSAAGNGMVSGAQPLVPTGSFAARWDGLR
jgi:hypothetical protein